jgi:methyl-accepting chemotaxis protein
MSAGESEQIGELIGVIDALADQLRVQAYEQGKFQEEVLKVLREISDHLHGIAMDGETVRNEVQQIAASVSELTDRFSPPIE